MKEEKGIVEVLIESWGINNTMFIAGMLGVFILPFLLPFLIIAIILKGGKLK